MKLCRDCQHKDRFGYCRAISGTSVVNGKKTYEICEVIRLNHRQCGEDAKLFIKRIPFWKFVFGL